MSDVVDLCAAPLSSPFAFLYRLHTYCLVGLLFWPLPRGWLFRSVLAALTTRTAVTAIYSFIQLRDTPATRPPGQDPAPAPLDAVAALEFLALASVVGAWGLLVSRRIAASRARPLVRIWSVLVAVGTVTAFVALQRAHRDAQRLTAAEARRALCDGGDVWLGYQKVWGPRFGDVRARVGVAGLVFAGLAAIAAMLPPIGSIQAKRHAEAHQFCEGIDATPTGSRGRRMDGLLRLSVILLSLAAPAMVMLIIVTSEMYFWNLGPAGYEFDVEHTMRENLSSVGQWDIWASTGIVALAIAFNAVREKMGHPDTETDHAPTKPVADVLPSYNNPIDHITLPTPSDWK